MLRGAALLFGLVATTLLAQEPTKDPDSFDIEPPLLMPMSVARRNFSLLAAPGNPTLPAPNKNLPSSSRRKIKSPISNRLLVRLYAIRLRRRKRAARHASQP